jgi:hypothetical protein
MPATDTCMVIALQLLLICFSLYSLVRDLRIRSKEKAGGFSAEVVRSDSSMTPVYTVYAAALASCLVLLDKAAGLDGHKVALILLDFVCLTYVFFFSTWFRNAVFFRLADRVRRD